MEIFDLEATYVKPLLNGATFFEAPGFLDKDDLTRAMDNIVSVWVGPVVVMAGSCKMLRDFVLP